MTGRLRVVATSVAVALLATGISGLTPANAARSGSETVPPGRIVVTQFLPDRIVSMLPDGTDRETVLKFPFGRHHYLSVSGLAVTADGGTIAVAFGNHRPNTHIFTVNADGSELTQVTHGGVSDGAPTFSPDGGSIAFSREEAGRSSLMRMDSDGSQLVNLTDPGEPEPFWMSWSPDGKYIAFASREKLVLTDPQGAWYRILRSVSPKRKQIVSVAWSPDSSTLAYDEASKKLDTWDLFTVSVDGTNRQQLTNTPHVDEYSPSYAPDGSAIACIAQRRNIGQLDVLVMNSDGSNRHVFQTTDDFEFDLVWGG